MSNEYPAFVCRAILLIAFVGLVPPVSNGFSTTTLSFWAIGIQKIHTAIRSPKDEAGILVSGSGLGLLFSSPFPLPPFSLIRFFRKGRAAQPQTLVLVVTNLMLSIVLPCAMCREKRAHFCSLNSLLARHRRTVATV
jgi:hypothetical protein